MIKKLTTSFLRTTKITSKAPLFSFSNVRDTLRKKLDQQIKYQGQNKPSVNEYINFFNNNGWDVNYNGTQVQLSRKSGDYNLRLLFNARNPTSETPEQEEGQQQQQQDFNENYSEISVYINKNGQPKWMCAQFFVTEQNSEIGGIRFVNSYQNERSDRFKERNSSTAYPGPELDSLQQALSDKIAQFIESVGVDHALLQNASNYSVAYEHQFYHEWLKDLRSVV